jgi:hypothetical protein
MFSVGEHGSIRQRSGYGLEVEDKTETSFAPLLAQRDNQAPCRSLLSLAGLPTVNVR